MPTRTRAIDEARRRTMRQVHELGDELRSARLVAGLTQRRVAAAIGSSQPEISRRERGRVRAVRLDRLSVHAAALGLRTSVRLYPAGGAIRDAAQARYIAAFVSRIGGTWKVAIEAPMPISGDLRALDIALRSRAGTVGVEVITRLTDLQAQVRAAQLKARDADLSRLVILVAATHANRRAVAEARPAILATFDLDARHVLADLLAGRVPPRDAMILFAA
jgi:transcriptional regulator with XRE-family HTH domain